MGRSRSSSRREREEKKSCCTWPLILIFVLSLAIAAFLVWWFEPWKQSGQNSANDNANDNGSSDSWDSWIPETLEPALKGSPAPTETPPFEFMQCDPDNTNTGQGDCCNGLEGICDLRANEIMYATLHNGMATVENGFVIGANHISPLEEALEAGYRGLNLDICNCGGEIIFCHGICSFGPRKVFDVMQGVNKFLDENPTETVVFIFQVNNDVDQEVDLNQFYDQLLLVDGFAEKIYVHRGPGNAWPTLREQTDPLVNKRVIMFHYNGPDCNENFWECPGGLHQYYNYASDNNWDYPSISSINNRTKSCPLRKNGINNDEFVGLNNFVSPPSRESAQKLNQYSAATDYVENCSLLLETDINFLLVDFWSEGDLPRFTQDHNAAIAQRRFG